jgi:tetratricopeptide (TPR) repeat protein
VFDRPSPARRALCLALALGQVWPALALAAEAPAIEQAKNLLDEGEFERALKAIDVGLNRAEVTAPTAARLYELQGTAWLYLGKDEKARESFENLLRLSRGYQLAKGSSGKARALLEEIRSRMAAASPPPKAPTVEVLPLQAIAGQPVELRADVRDLPAGARPRAFWRQPGAARFGSSPMSEAGNERWAAQVPGFEVPDGERGVLEYYVEIADAQGNRLGGAGSSERPMALQVLGRPRPTVQAGEEKPPAPAVAEEIAEPWYRKWWVWTIAGGLAIGAGAAVAYPLVKGQRAEIPITIQVQQ